MIPKNVRQIGQIGGNKRIYIEDYVMTYARKIEGMAVLLGRQEYEEGNTLLYISGAVGVKEVAYGYPTILTNEDWSEIYEDVKRHFMDYEIVGWLLVRKDVILEIDEDVRRIHQENFKGDDKILFLFDKGEGEESFYLSDARGELKKQTGYYIYYEKNEAMQNYMIEKNQGEKVEDTGRDEAMEKVREIVSAKDAPVKDKKVINLMYGASTLLAAVVLVIGATMLDNYDKMKNMEETLNTISNNLEEGEKTVSNNGIEVEKVSGNTQENKEEPPEKEIPNSQGELTQENRKDNETGEDSGSNPPPDSQEDTKDPKSLTEPESKDESGADNEADNGDEEENEQKQDNQDSRDNKENEKDKEVSAEGRGSYIVKKGDTLASISLTFYQSLSYVEKIQELNGIDDSDRILEGQTLLLP